MPATTKSPKHDLDEARKYHRPLDPAAHDRAEAEADALHELLHPFFETHKPHGLDGEVYGAHDHAQATETGWRRPNERERYSIELSLYPSRILLDTRGDVRRQAAAKLRKLAAILAEAARLCDPTVKAGTIIGKPALFCSLRPTNCTFFCYETEDVEIRVTNDCDLETCAKKARAFVEMLQARGAVIPGEDDVEI